MEKYTSLFSPNKKVTAAQYILELICDNKAKHLNISLPIKFWFLPEWANYYKFHLKKVHALLKKYDSTVLINVIKTKNIYSLYPDWVIIEFDKEKNKIATLKIEEQNHKRIINSKGQQTKNKDLSKFD